MGNNTKENKMENEDLDRIIWNAYEAGWYGVPVGKYTYRQMLAKWRAENDRIRKAQAEQG